MSFRLVLATSLAISSCTLLAQPNINVPILIDNCLKLPVAAARDCLTKNWGSSLNQVSQYERQNVGVCEKNRANDRNVFNQQMGKMQGDFEKQVAKVRSDCDAQIRVITGKDFPAALDNARAEEREKIRARRTGGINAIKVFLYDLDANGKALDREVELVIETGLAGTILVRRKNGTSAILLPFPSLASVSLAKNEKETRLVFDCRTEVKECVTWVEKDGSLRTSAGVQFVIAPANAEDVRKSAHAAIQAFTD